MELTVGAGALLTAGVLGTTHGIEPDHVAGIAALTHEAADPKLSALVGGCFAAGHAIAQVVASGLVLIFAVDLLAGVVPYVRTPPYFTA